MNTFSTRKGGVSHTFNGVTGSRTSDFKRIDYVLTRQAHRRIVRNVVVHPQPALPVKADSDHNMVIATVDLGGHVAHNRAIRAKPKQRKFSRQELQVEMSRWHVVERFLHNLGEQTGQPNTTAPEAARGFTGGREGVHRSYPRSSADSASDRGTDTTYQVCRSGVKARKREQQ